MGTKTSCQPREPCRLLTVPSKLWRNSLQTTETFIQGGLCSGYSQKLIIKMPPLDRVFVYCVFVREKNSVTVLFQEIFWPRTCLEGVHILPFL